MKSVKRSVFVGFLLISTAVSAQQYSFRYLTVNDNYEINSDGDKLYCFFKIAKTAQVSLFRKVFLNEQLKVIDSVQYQLSGDAELIGTGANDVYSYHVFLTKVGGTHVFDFLITDKEGNVQASYSKEANDFAPYFGKEYKIRNIDIRFLPNHHHDQLLLQIQEGSHQPIIIAWNTLDGSPQWRSMVPPLSSIQVTDSLLIGLAHSQISNGNPTDVIYFVDRFSGKQLNAVLVNAGKDPRAVAILASNGRQVLIAGDEYEDRSTKKSHFYMTMFDLHGSKIYDRVDTVDRTGKFRRQLLGSVFDSNGNLVLMAQGYKFDATKAIATTATGVAFAVLLGGRVIVTPSMDNRIEFITCAVLSPEDGEVKYFKTYPVGPWSDFAVFMADGQNILIGVSNKFLIYNANTPDAPPEFFASLRTRERLVLTPHGPVISFRRNGKEVVLELVRQQDTRK